MVSAVHRKTVHGPAAFYDGPLRHGQAEYGDSGCGPGSQSAVSDFSGAAPESDLLCAELCHDDLGYLPYFVP